MEAGADLEGVVVGSAVADAASAEEASVGEVRASAGEAPALAEGVRASVEVVAAAGSLAALACGAASQEGVVVPRWAAAPVSRAGRSAGDQERAGASSAVLAGASAVRRSSASFAAERNVARHLALVAGSSGEATGDLPGADTGVPAISGAESGSALAFTTPIANG